MDCRMSFLAVLTLSFGGGCVTTQPSEIANKPPESTKQVAVEQPKDSARRQPLPGTVVAVAVIKERDADKMDNAALKMRTYDDARKYFQDALKIDPNYRDTIQGLARVYTKMEDFEHALEIYNKTLAKNPKDHGMWFDLGSCYSRKKDLAAALPCFQKALELDPENRAYMKQVGFTQARLGQTEQGLAQLTRAMGAALAHYNLARMFEHMGQKDECRRHLEIALQLNPNLDEAREMLSQSPAQRANLEFRAQ
jgi:tetratricopeptide (TPR) repeat protein